MLKIFEAISIFLLDKDENNFPRLQTPSLLLKFVLGIGENKGKNSEKSSQLQRFLSVYVAK